MYKAIFKNTDHSYNYCLTVHKPNRRLNGLLTALATISSSSKDSSVVVSGNGNGKINDTHANIVRCLDNYNNNSNLSIIIKHGNDLTNTKSRYPDSYFALVKLQAWVRMTTRRIAWIRTRKSIRYYYYHNTIIIIVVIIMISGFKQLFDVSLAECNMLKRLVSSRSRL